MSKTRFILFILFTACLYIQTGAMQSELNEQLIQAVENNNATEVVRLISLKADLDTRYCDSSTVLMRACLGKRTEIVKILLNAGADVNGCSNAKNMALIATICPRDIDNLKNEVHYREDDKNIAHPEDIEIVLLLLDAQADVNACNIVGGTPLMFAASFNNTEVGRLLLLAGADPSASDNDHGSAYSIAVKQRHFKFRDLLDYHKKMLIEWQEYKTNFKIEIIINNLDARTCLLEHALACNDIDFIKALIASVPVSLISPDILKKKMPTKIRTFLKRYFDIVKTIYTLRKSDDAASTFGLLPLELMQYFVDGLMLEE